jgi:ATP-dependent DNA ligase
MKYLDIINHIKTLSTEKDFQTYLVSLKDDSTWLRLLKMTYDPSINYWVKNIDMSYIAEYIDGTTWSLETCLDELEKCSKRILTGDAAYNHVLNIMAHCNEPELINLILQRTFRMGIEVKTFNKAYGSSFIKETPYMRCGLLSAKTLKNISYPAFSQLKCDGQYIAMIITENEVQCVSRQGKDYDFLSVFDESALALRKEYGYDIVLTGEMLYLDTNGIVNRQTGNGIVQKFGKSTGTIEEAKQLKYFIWDVISYQSYLATKENSKYIDRYTNLVNIINKYHIHNIEMVETRICNTQQEVYDHYFECVERKEEGTIVKDFTLDWKFGTATKQLKVKLEFDVDLRIVGFKQGSKGTWNENILGSVICESEDGILSASPGQWSEDLRYHIWENQEEYLGQVITVTAHRVTSDKKTGKPSLYLPRFKAWRAGDKDTADSYARILEIEESITMIKTMTHEM